MAEQTNLVVEPFHVQSILDFQIQKGVGCHIICSLQVLLTKQDGENDQKSIKEKTELTISIANGVKLFQGVIAMVRYTAEVDGIYVQVLASSRTCLLDEKTISKSYQDINMTYSQIADEIKKGYSDIDLIYSTEKDGKIDQFTLQYQETDWAFLNRMASRLHVPLIAEALSDKISCCFGVPKGKKIEIPEDQLRLNYQVNYSPGIYRTWKENEEAVSEKSVVQYVFQIEQNISISVGARLSFDKKSLLVKEVLTYRIDHVLAHQLTCTEEEGFFLETKYNPRIAGLHLKAKVTKAIEDKLEVHLYEIDKDKPKTAYPFVYLTMYAAEGNAGWYFMPEIEDTVYIRFPTEDEKDAVADGSIRAADEKEDQVQDPEIKYIRTADGQEIMLTKDEIKISTKEKDLFIRISEKSGIEISSNKAIHIKSEKEIQMSAKSKMLIQAKEELKLVSKSCEIKLGATMDVKGNVKIN